MLHHHMAVRFCPAPTRAAWPPPRLPAFRCIASHHRIGSFLRRSRHDPGLRGALRSFKVSRVQLGASPAGCALSTARALRCHCDPASARWVATGFQARTGGITTQTGSGASSRLRCRLQPARLSPAREREIWQLDRQSVQLPSPSRRRPPVAAAPGDTVTVSWWPHAATGLSRTCRRPGLLFQAAPASVLQPTEPPG